MAFADLIVGKWNRNLFPWFTPGSRFSGCISFVSYIKPQLVVVVFGFSSVVYLSFPTSNHNKMSEKSNKTWLYIFRFLHQTTTFLHDGEMFCSCISFVSYIKPQPCNDTAKHKHVVYLSFPTSNHNSRLISVSVTVLYIFRFLHQTTTNHYDYEFALQLYIFRFLHQTTTQIVFSKRNRRLYIFRFLHQTTTIKPFAFIPLMLYIFRFLHQTTTIYRYCQPHTTLYIFRFLHQTTTETSNDMNRWKLYIFRFLHQTTTHPNT